MQRSSSFSGVMINGYYPGINITFESMVTGNFMSFLIWKTTKESGKEKIYITGKKSNTWKNIPATLLLF